VLRDYAPVPGTLVPGRTAALRVVIGAEYLSSSPPAKLITDTSIYGHSPG
jgi:hypothetical protein